MGILVNQTKVDAIKEAKRIADIKAEAQARIITLVGATEETFVVKELNLLMQNAELDDIVINGGALTVEQQAVKDNLLAIKDGVKEIRAMSDAAETAGDNLATYQAALDLAGY